MATLHDVLKDTQNCLHKNIGYSLDEAKLEARFILEHVLNITQKEVIQQGDQTINVKDQNHIELITLKRLEGEPLSYLLGEWSFYGRIFKVNANVLIPRPDTETLIEHALKKINVKDAYQILDLGSGTGIIGITIALERPLSKVLLIDQSEHALKNTRNNQSVLKVRNVTIQKSDWFNAIDKTKFDMILSNPPYLKTDDTHLLDGLQHEPIEAIVSGLTGIEDIQHIIESSKTYLKELGWLFIEHGYDQADILKNLFKANHYQNIQQAKDIHGVVRVTYGQYSIV